MGGEVCFVAVAGEHADGCAGAGGPRHLHVVAVVADDGDVARVDAGRGGRVPLIPGGPSLDARSACVNDQLTAANRGSGASHAIDGNCVESAEIRRAAGDELKSTTKEYFGYYDDLPVAERQKAQNRYREWWENKGKARFR